MREVMQVYMYVLYDVGWWVVKEMYTIANINLLQDEGKTTSLHTLPTQSFVLFSPSSWICGPSCSLLELIERGVEIQNWSTEKKSSHTISKNEPQFESVRKWFYSQWGWLQQERQRNIWCISQWTTSNCLEAVMVWMSIHKINNETAGCALTKPSLHPLLSRDSNLDEQLIQLPQMVEVLLNEREN